MKRLKTQNDVFETKRDGDIDGLNVTVYAYKLNIGGREQSLFQENSHTVCYIERWDKLEAIGTSIEINTTIIAENNSLDGTKQKLLNATTLDFEADVNVFETFSKDVFVFTVGEPLDVNRHRKGEQEVFISRNTIPSEINQKIEPLNAKMAKVHEMDIAENVTLYSLVNIQEINQLSNSVVRFTFERRIKNPTDIIVRYDKSWARNKILAKGKIDDNFTDIDLKDKDGGTSSKHGILKLTPISVMNKLTCFSDTLDLNMSLVYEIAEEFKGPAGLRQKIVTDDTGWKKALWTTFLSILELTRAYSNRFADYLITQDGKTVINPAAVIGGQAISMLPGTNKTDALEAIDGRIEQWKLENPEHITTNEFKLFKVFVFMLTPFVQTNLALGGGLNQVNKVHSLFYFDLRTPIVTGIASVDTKDVEVILKSEFYNIDDTNGNLVLKDQFKEYSTYQALDVDGWASLAELPKQINTTTRFGKPGDMNPNSENLSKYFIYVPVDNDEKLKKLYGEKTTSHSTGPTETSISKSVNGVQGPSVREQYQWMNKEYGVEGKAQALAAVKAVQPPTPTEIYNAYVKDQLPSNQRMKFISGVPAITNIAKSNYQVITSGGSGATGAFGGGGYIFYVGTYTLSFDVTIIQTGGVETLTLTAEGAVIDKEKFLEINKFNLSTTNKVVCDLELSSKNKLSTITELDQLILTGMWGNEFEIIIKGEDNDGNAVELAMGDFEFMSKYDESQTTTLLNL